jgi:hypothetical protein
MFVYMYGLWHRDNACSPWSHIHECMYAYVCVCETYVCMGACVYICMYVRARATICMCAWVNACVSARIYACVICMYVRVYARS